MMRYPVQPRDQVFVKSYVFLSFANNLIIWVKILVKI